MSEQEYVYELLSRSSYPHSRDYSAGFFKTREAAEKEIDRLCDSLDRDGDPIHYRGEYRIDPHPLRG